MNAKVKNIVTYIIFFGIGLGLLHEVYKEVDLGELWESLHDVNVFWVIVSFVMGYLAIISRGIRWTIMLDPMGYKPSKWNSISTVAFAYFMNTFIPRSGELARCAALNQIEGVPVDKLIGTVISERIVDFVMLFIFMFFGIALNIDSFLQLMSDAKAGQEDRGYANLMIFAAALGVLVLAIIIFYKKIKKFKFYLKIIRFLLGIREGLKSVFAMKKKGWFIFHTCFIWLMYFLMAFVVFSAIPGLDDVGIPQGLFIVVAGGFGMVFPSPGGTGSYHYAIKLGFLALGMSGELGLKFATIVWFTQTIMVIFTGGIGFIAVTLAKVKRNKLRANPR